jgi:hypothetical protein
MHKENFIINLNTFLHVSTLLGHRQGELLGFELGWGGVVGGVGGVVW